MPAVLLALHGPLQSWGAASKLGTRTTRPVPTRSALLGMVEAACGLPPGGRSENQVALASSIASLRVLVRADRSGVLLTDLHNITQGAMKASNTRHGDTIQSRRQYRADAAFLVALDGGDAVVEQVAAALDAPKWHLSMGRRSCPPATPFHLGVVDSAIEAFETLPALKPAGEGALFVVAPYGALPARPGWKPLRTELGPTAPVTNRYRRYLSERTQTFNISDAHTGGRTGDPFEVLIAARTLAAATNAQEPT